jgi:hypothetical protein
MKIHTNELRGVMVDGKPALVRIHAVPRHWRDKPRSTTLVSVDGPVVEPSWDHPRFSVKGENENLDAAWRAFNREEVRLRKIVFHALGFSGRFSRKAGCSCGCSPAFRAHEHVWTPTRGTASWVFVDVQPLKIF